jgi:hypothetical protein
VPHHAAVAEEEGEKKSARWRLLLLHVPFKKGFKGHDNNKPPPPFP